MSHADELDPMASLGEWLAYDVRRYREMAQMSQRRLAEVLRVSYQQMCNLEANRRKFTKEHVTTLDELWDTRGHFLRLWTHAQREHDREWFRKYTAFERRARSIKIWQPLIVPGLFQTSAYARAYVRAGRAPDMEMAIERRMERQEILTAETPPRVLAMLDEKALRQPIGGAEVMRGQLAHLLEVADLPNVTLQVVPTRAGAFVGLDGGFILLCGESGDIAFSEAQLGGRLIRDEDEVNTLEVRYDWIRAKALSEDDSKALITGIMGSME